MLKERIADHLSSFLDSRKLFLVEVKATPQDRITVYVDGWKNITIDICVEISRMLEAFLEEEKLVRENYTLDVSSPGMGQPFRVRQQYEKSVGRTVEVLKADGIKHKGVLQEVDDEAVALHIEKKLKKKKEVVTEKVVIPFSDIKATRQLITFK